jgi:predicted secreted protein
MLDPILNVAIFIIWWWMALFAMLPIGVKSVEEADIADGHDPGAPRVHNLRRKAVWALGAAAILWAITATIVFFDPFHIRR